MPIEALVWSLLLILGPSLALRVWPKLPERFNQSTVDIKSLAPWFHGLGIPYLALIIGSVSSRRVGLYGFPTTVWVSGGIACTLGLAAANFTLGRLKVQPDPEQKLSFILLEETRWAFYRGAAYLWLPFPFSILLGLGLSLLEWGITHVVGHGRQQPSPAKLKVLIRAGLSTLLFFATGNFWLTAGTQLLLTSIISKQVESPPISKLGT